MKRKTLACWIAAVLVAVSVSGPAAAQAPALSIDDIIKKNVDAKGGIDKLKAVNTIRMTGKMQAGPMEAPLVVEAARPKKVRVEFTVQGMTGIQAYNGTTGWMVMPFTGKKDPEALPSEQLKSMEDQADFDGPLVDYKEKGNTVEYLGQQEMEGTKVHALKVTKKNGDVATLYLDADSFLELKAVAKTQVNGQEVEGETSFGNYKEVGGLVFAHTMESKAKGMPGPGATMTFEKIEINPEIAADRFEMPAKAAPAKP